VYGGVKEGLLSCWGGVFSEKGFIVMLISCSNFELGWARL
jgi:hypothetical protein